MALGGTYATGTISVSATGTVVTGTGTLWTSVAEQGDWLFANGHIGIIATIDDDTHLTLYDPWTGDELTDAPYRIIKMSWLRYDPSLTQSKLRAVLAALEAPTVIFFVEGAVPDPGLGADGQYALKSNSGTWKLWFKTGGTWVLQSTPVGVQWGGTWNPVTNYPANSAVERLGSTYVSRSVNINKPPESNPSDWDLAAAKGADGNHGGISIRYAFDAASQEDSDPGNGRLRLDQATQNTATVIRADLLDAAGSTVTSLLDQLSASTSTVKAQLRLAKEFDPAKFIDFDLTSLDSPAGYRNLIVTVIDASSANPFADGDVLVLSVARVGDKGETGTIGPVGETGPQGETPAPQWNFSDAVTDTDPGNGLFRINDAAYAFATYLYFDDLDRNGASQTSLLDSFDDSTTPGNRGTLFLQQVGASAVYAIFTVTGDVIDGTGYRKLPVSHVMSRGAFTDGLAAAVSFARTGDKGLDGLGAGDTISDISSVTPGRLVKYSDPSGKHITDAGASIGTSGHSVPVLDANNTWSGAQNFDGGLAVPDAAFAYAKIQDVSATSRFLGRKSPGAGVIEELTASDARTILNITEGAILGQPQGRLTLLSGTPVPYGATGSVTHYYTPYLGQLVPLYDGTNWIMHDIGGELSQALSDATKSPAAAAANSLYDVFVWNDSGGYRLSRGPAWTNNTTRSLGLSRIKGIFVNATAISNGPAANHGTYVGTVMTDGAAQVNFTLGSAAAGGGAAELGVWNMYNRASIRAMVQDSTSTWTYSGTAYRPANNSNNNRVTWVVGINEDIAEIRYSVLGQASAPEPVLGISLAYAGIGIDTTSALTGISTAAAISSSTAINLIGLAQGAWSGLTGVGKHFAQAIEISPTGAAVSYFGTDHMALIFACRM